MPGIDDPRFERAVIAMCVHDEGGAMGIGVGTEIEGISLHGLLTQLEIDPGIAPDVPVLAGGPVEPQRGFVLHSQDWAGEGSVQIGNSYTLTRSEEHTSELQSLMRNSYAVFCLKKKTNIYKKKK